MADARIIEVCDAIVDKVTLAWVPLGADGVSRQYLTPVKAEFIQGRQVYVFPANYGDEPADRADDLKEHRVALLVVERYTDAGAPTVEWIDERVNFVQTFLWDELTNPRSQAILDDLWPHTGEVAVYDVAMLSEKKLFWSELDLVFREIGP